MAGIDSDALAKQVVRVLYLLAEGRSIEALKTDIKSLADNYSMTSAELEGGSLT